MSHFEVTKRLEGEYRNKRAVYVEENPSLKRDSVRGLFSGPPDQYLAGSLW